MRRLLLLALLLFGGIGAAQAHTPPCNAQTGGAGVQCTREQAYAYASSGAQAVMQAHCDAAWGAGTHTAEIYGTGGAQQLTGSYRHASGLCRNNSTGGTNSSGTQHIFYYYGCPAGSTWNDTTKKCEVPNDCPSKPDQANSAIRGGPTMCKDGCEYQMTPAAQDKNPANVCMGVAAQRYCGSDRWEPTGQQCPTETPLFGHDPDKDTCGTIPGSSYGECVKRDGTHCVTTPSGRSLCWKPGETGPRTTSDGKDGADRQIAPGIPTAPTNMENPTPGPSTNTNINNTNYTTNIYTGTGSTPGQNPGTGVDGDNDGDGEDDDGDEGSLSGGGSCAAPPACEGNPIECYHAQEAWRLRCDALNDPENADLLGIIAGYHEEEAGDVAPFLGADGQGDLDSHREVKEIDLGELDESGFLGGGGSCPTFSPVIVKGVNMGFDMTKMCGFLANVGQIVLALAYLVAIRIIVTGGGR